MLNVGERVYLYGNKYCEGVVVKREVLYDPESRKRDELYSVRFVRNGAIMTFNESDLTLKPDDSIDVDYKGQLSIAEVMGYHNPFEWKDEPVGFYNADQKKDQEKAFNGLDSRKELTDFKGFNYMACPVSVGDLFGRGSNIGTIENISYEGKNRYSITTKLLDRTSFHEKYVHHLTVEEIQDMKDEMPRGNPEDLHNMATHEKNLFNVHVSDKHNTSAFIDKQAYDLSGRIFQGIKNNMGGYTIFVGKDGKFTPYNIGDSRIEKVTETHLTPKKEEVKLTEDKPASPLDKVIADLTCKDKFTTIQREKLEGKMVIQQRIIYKLKDSLRHPSNNLREKALQEVADLERFL